MPKWRVPDKLWTRSFWRDARSHSEIRGIKINWVKENNSPKSNSELMTPDILTKLYLWIPSKIPIGLLRSNESLRGFMGFRIPSGIILFCFRSKIFQRVLRDIVRHLTDDGVWIGSACNIVGSTRFIWVPRTYLWDESSYSRLTVSAIDYTASPSPLTKRIRCLCSTLRIDRSRCFRCLANLADRIIGWSNHSVLHDHIPPMS